MSELFHPSVEFVNHANVRLPEYQQMYQESIEKPDQFWARQAEQRLTWIKKWHTVSKTSFTSPVSIEWFLGAQLNACYNCIDRHLPQHQNRVAYIFESDDPQQAAQKITYGELLEQVSRYANVLKKHGVQKGDRVAVYLPMIPEAIFTMLACARIGAVHTVIFAGFSVDAIVDRINDCDAHWVVTTEQAVRGGKKSALKANVDQAVQKTSIVKKVFTVAEIQTEFSSVSGHCECAVMEAEDPLFILYTSGSTNKPKGVLHTTGGYLLYASMTFSLIFDYKPDDVFWCTADIGWVTGHSYVVYGPLANAATSVIFAGIPSYPDHSRFWQVIDRHQVTLFYTAPTALRALIKEGDQWVQKCSLQSLRLLGSVGEPLNPEAWRWYHHVIGKDHCPIVDTWWQTETGGILLAPLPGAFPLKAGSVTLPFFGVQPKLLTPEGTEIPGPGEGVLALAGSWPGQARTIYRDHARFEQTYFSTYQGLYFTGDGAKRDQDGYYWITGRVDDVLNVSGHRLGTAEIESALTTHPAVAEAAVVGCPHDIKGTGIYAFVTLHASVTATDNLRAQLTQWVGKVISPIAKPDHIQWAPGLPKTRSGKIMRRILRKIAENQADQLGDTSTLADPSVVEDLLKNRQG